MAKDGGVDLGIEFRGVCFHWSWVIGKCVGRHEFPKWGPDFPGAATWNAYLNAFAARVNSPLRVTTRGE